MVEQLDDCELVLMPSVDVDAVDADVVDSAAAEVVLWSSDNSDDSDVELTLVVDSEPLVVEQLHEHDAELVVIPSVVEQLFSVDSEVELWDVVSAAVELLTGSERSDDSEVELALTVDSEPLVVEQEQLQDAELVLISSVLEVVTQLTLVVEFSVDSDVELILVSLVVEQLTLDLSQDSEVELAETHDSDWLVEHDSDTQDSEALVVEVVLADDSDVQDELFEQLQEFWQDSEVELAVELISFWLLLQLSVSDEVDASSTPVSGAHVAAPAVDAVWNHACESELIQIAPVRNGRPMPAVSSSS